MSTPGQQAYASDHSTQVIAQHGRRKVADSAIYLADALRSSGKPVEEIKFLDVGCGPGSITNDFAKNYFPKCHFTGVDYTDAPVNQARAAAEQAGLTNTEFLVGDVHNLPFPDDSFEVVYCHQVLQHVADPVKALSEMRRVCKVGGIVGVKESSLPQWYPDMPGLSAKWDLHQKVSRAMGGDPFPGKHIHVWAKQAGYTRDQITCSTSTWLFATREGREYWGGIYANRMDPDADPPTAFTKNALEGGYATKEEMRVIRDDFRKWVEDEDGWYCIVHGEIICRK